MHVHDRFKSLLSAMTIHATKPHLHAAYYVCLFLQKWRTNSSATRQNEADINSLVTEENESSQEKAVEFSPIGGLDNIELTNDSTDYKSIQNSETTSL